jgi:hypothetical protein
MAKQPKTSAELEDMILQKLLIGGVYASVRRDQIFGWQGDCNAKAIQERTDTIAAELRKKLTLKD